MGIAAGQRLNTYRGHGNLLRNRSILAYCFNYPSRINGFVLGFMPHSFSLRKFAERTDQSFVVMARYPKLSKQLPV
jgi:hypothetical protein